MPLRFTLRQLEYLVAVGECGSISQAAERLSVSPPSISTSIAQLEAEFGFPIFVRKHAQGMSLTRDGRVFLAEAQAVLCDADRLNDLANDITGRVRGPFKVGCLQTFAQIVLPQLRRSFVDRYTEIEFQQTEAHQMALIEMLRNADIDIALTYDLSIPADLVFVELATLPPYLVFPEAHPLAGRESVALAEVAPYPMVLLDLPLSSDYFLALFAAAGARPNIVERTRDLPIAQSLVANGFGYTIANIPPVTDLSPDGHRLRFVPLTAPVRPLRMGLVHAGGGASFSKARAFVAHCRENLSTSIIGAARFPPGGEPKRDGG